VSHASDLAASLNKKVQNIVSDVASSLHGTGKNTHGVEKSTTGFREWISSYPNIESK
jgi:hypothetical protein